MRPDFDIRSQALEMMDEKDIPEQELELALQELGTINRFLSGYRPSLFGIARLLRPDCGHFTMLDVGCGGGDFAKAAWDHFSRRKIVAEITGIDLSPDTAAFAGRACMGFSLLRFQQQDLFEMDGEGLFDVVHASLVLHHFSDENIGDALEKMFRLSRLGVVVNDLHRHPLAYYSIRFLTQLFSHSSMIKNDAPLSVLRGFRRDEIIRLVQDAGLPTPEIHWHHGFRWQIVIPCSRGTRIQHGGNGDAAP